MEWTRVEWVEWVDEIGVNRGGKQRRKRNPGAKRVYRTSPLIITTYLNHHDKKSPRQQTPKTDNKHRQQAQKSD